MNHPNKRIDKTSMFTIRTLILIAAMALAPVLITACAGGGGGGGGGSSAPSEPPRMPDTDLDGIPDAGDNCPNTPNAAQRNQDGDDLGDACDPDVNNNGLQDIRNATALREMLSGDPTGRYELTADIRLNATGAWQPIGVDDAPFRGVLDGRGHTIRDARIDPGGASGLFGIVRRGVIRNLRLEVADVAAVTNPSPSYAGGLAGRVENGTIEDVYVIVTGDVSARVGGNRSAANADAGLSFAGGLVGAASNSNITNSYVEVEGDVWADSNVSLAFAGGLVGDANNLRLNNSYAEIGGDIAATTAAMNNMASAGGLVGRGDAGAIAHSYAVARNISAVALNVSLATDPTYAGGLVGFVMTNSPAATNAYYYAADLHANVTDVAPLNLGANRTLAQLQCPRVLNDNRCPGDPVYVDWDNETIWDLRDNLTLPTVRSILTRDTDGDGVFDLEDNCLRVPNPSQANLDNQSERANNQMLLGDACDDDDDNDGIEDMADNCPLVVNADQANLDNATGDLLGDACDDDIDGDGVANANDNCPSDYRPSQMDSDGDGCDDGPGTDNETQMPVDNETQMPVDNETQMPVDNETQMPVDNETQMPVDNETQMPVVDNDTDGDNILNGQDNCLMDPNPDQDDVDGDTYGDVCGPDRNDDGIREIQTPAQLDAVRTNLSASYELITNITLTADYANWQPLGNETTPFTGVFDGNHYTIRNLSSSGYARAGLFGVAQNAAFSNLTLLVDNIAGEGLGLVTVGTLVGQASAVAVSGIEVKVMGSVSGRGIGSAQVMVGGLFGRMAGNAIDQSYVFVVENITAISPGSTGIAGGLIGRAFSSGATINNSYVRVNGRVHSQGSGTSISGGLIGNSESVGYHVESSYTVVGTLAGSNPPNDGGLVGISFGVSNSNTRIINSYYDAAPTRVDFVRTDSTPYRRNRTQLECPTMVNRTCAGATTYTDWDEAIWDFGDAQTLPTLRGRPRPADLF